MFNYGSRSGYYRTPKVLYGVTTRESDSHITLYAGMPLLTFHLK